MSEIDKNNFQHNDFESSYKINSFNCNLYNQSDWSPPIEKELLELKSPVKTKNNHKFENKVICLVIGILGLLSIGLCVQANAIAQALREIARISVQQTIYINHQ